MKTLTLEILDRDDPEAQDMVCVQCGQPTRVRWYDDADDTTPIPDCGGHTVADSVRVARTT